MIEIVPNEHRSIDGEAPARAETGDLIEPGASGYARCVRCDAAKPT